MNFALVLTHNNLALTKRCVKSVRNQDVDCIVILIDNDSQDGTWEWAKTQEKVIPFAAFIPQIGVSAGWNVGLKYLFESEDASSVLVVNNDVVLAPWTFDELLSCNVPFVTGVAVETMEQIANPPEQSKLIPHPDFSCYLIRKSVWEKVGSFDERFWGWSGDCDYHCRAHRMGIDFWKANVPFYHIRSRTIELAPSREKRDLELQAEVDREEFAKKWKVAVGSPRYADLFLPEAFGIDL